MHKRSYADPISIQQHVYDETVGANRVVIVGNETFQPGATAVPTKIEQVIVEKPIYIDRVEYKTIEVPVIVKEVETKIEKIEVPVFVEKVVVKEIPVEVIKEIPVYKTIEIEKPVIITHTEYKDLPKWLVVCFAFQAFSTLIIEMLKFFK